MPATIRRRAAWAAALFLAILSACSSERETARRAAKGPAGTAVIANLQDLESVNPLINKSSDFHRDIERMLYRQLVEESAEFEKGPPEFSPQLAESWQTSEDGRTLTFRLQEGLTWSDGEPLTAADVRWTWQAQTLPEVAWARVESKEKILDVEVVDPLTVRFHFRQPYPSQLVDANEGAVLPRHAWSSKPFSEWRSDAGWFADHAVSSGPFKLGPWRSNEELTLVRNERFQEPGLPKLDRLLFRILPDMSTQIQQILAGRVDYVRSVPADQIVRLEHSPDVEIDSFQRRRYDYLCWNLERTPLSEKGVRRALTLGIDRQQIIDTIYHGYAKVAISPVISTTWAFHRGLSPWPHDPDAARLVLAGEGFTDADGDGYVERDGERLSFELLVQAGTRVHVEAAAMIQEQLRQTGVEVKIRQLEFSTWFERLTSHEFDAAIGGWNIDTSLDLSYAFHGDGIAGGYNFGSYANPEVDRLIEEAELAGEIESRKELLFKLQEILHDELPYTFLWEPMGINGRRVRLKGTRPNAMSSFDDIEHWWVEGAAAP